MTSLWYYISVLPVATFSAVVFYASIVLLLVLPGLRRWASTNLVMPAPASNQRYLAPLDALRGFAALWIALGHTLQFPQPVFDASKSVLPFIAIANNAVPIFCMLSGFLIYRSVVRITAGEDLRKYLISRIFRIFPAYVTTVIACIAIGQLPLDLPRVLNDVFMLRSFFGIGITNPPSWSLYVEVLFYGLMPCVVAVAGRRMTVFCICAVIILLIGDTGGTRELALWKYFFLGALMSIAVTSLRAKLETVSPSMRQKIPLAIFCLGVLIACLMLFVYSISLASLLGIDAYRSVIYAIGLGLGSTFLIVGAICSPPLVHLFGIAPLRYLGAISYGLYLWHPIFIWLNFPQMQFDQAGVPQAFAAQYSAMPFWYMPLVFMPGELVLATLSFILVERPFLLMRPKFNQRPAQELSVKPSGAAL